VWVQIADEERVAYIHVRPEELEARDGVPSRRGGKMHATGMFVLQKE
jgi:hypothetical protein